MKRKVKENFSCRKFMSGDPPKPFGDIIEPFSRQTHDKHTTKKYDHVHAAMDKLAGKKGLGRYHRIYGHSVKFVDKNFKTKKERAAGYTHLLADFIDDALSDIFKTVLNDLEKENFLPPQFFIIKDGRALWDVREKTAKEILDKYGQGEWDLTLTAIQDIVAKFSGIFITTLKNKKNRKCIGQ